MFKHISIFVPPHPGAGIAIRGYTWVSGWYPAATELRDLKKAYSSQKRLVSWFALLRFLRREETSPSSRTLIFLM